MEARSARSLAMASALVTVLVSVTIALDAPLIAKKGPVLLVRDDPSIGESTAPLVLIEFADFQ